MEVTTMDSAPDNVESAAKSVKPTDIETDVPPATNIDWSTIEINDVVPCDTDTAEFLGKGTIMADVPYVNSNDTDRCSLALTVHLETSNGSAYATGGTIEYV